MQLTFTEEKLRIVSSTTLQFVHFDAFAQRLLAWRPDMVGL